MGPASPGGGALLALMQSGPAGGLKLAAPQATYRLSGGRAVKTAAEYSSECRLNAEDSTEAKEGSGHLEGRQRKPAPGQGPSQAQHHPHTITRLLLKPFTANVVVLTCRTSAEGDPKLNNDVKQHCTAQSRCLGYMVYMMYMRGGGGGGTSGEQLSSDRAVQEVRRSEGEHRDALCPATIDPRLHWGPAGLTGEEHSQHAERTGWGNQHSLSYCMDAVLDVGDPLTASDRPALPASASASHQAPPRSRAAQRRGDRATSLVRSGRKRVTAFTGTWGFLPVGAMGPRCL
ncbi:unnamed protein product [Lota lota]